MKDALPLDSVGGRYRIVSRIASGGMGTVFRARDSVLGRTVALKVLPAELALRPGFVERFRAEAQAAARLSHPNVVQVYDWGGSDSVYFMVMEHVRGRNVREILAGRVALEPRQAAEVILGVLAALDAAHERGLVHRDIKPENVLVTAGGAVKVTDFGIARLAEAGATSGELMGTVAYIAPEQIRGGAVDSRADLYSTGCLLHELVCGSPPFGGDVGRILHQHLTARVPPPSTEHPEAAPLDRVVLKATDPDVAARYPGAAAMATDLKAALEDLPAAPPLAELVTELTSEVPLGTLDTLAVTPEVTTHPRRRRWPLRVAAIVVIAAAVTGYLLRPARVPEVSGLARAVAERRIVEARLGLAASRSVGSDAPPGEVVASRPAPGKLLARGSSVVLVVSRGPDLADVPRLGGLGRGEAEELIRGARLIVGEVREQHAPQPPGTVLDQEPEPGKVRAQTPVNLVVSAGPELAAVPDVAGKRFEEARAALRQAGFGALRAEVFHEAPVGTVVDQTPKPGTSLEKGDSVRLVVSKGARPFAMPDVGGKTCAEAKGLLESLGLAVSVQSRGRGCSSNPVQGQDPLPGAMVRKGQEATLYVA
ncbi:MAG: protein kinase domain-containing protein [Actinomycetota bacterium]